MSERLCDLGVDFDERITEVTKCKQSLTIYGRMIFLYHQYVIFKTDTWWWTIEKNSECIVIQRSKYRDNVKKNFGRESRDWYVYTITEGKTRIGQRNVGELIQWLLRKDELNNEYHYLIRNCQHFAVAVAKFLYSQMKHTETSV